MIYNSIFSVVTPAAGYALVDLATVKDELEITDSSLDARLTRWILEAGAAIQGPVGIARVLRADTCSESFRAAAYQPDAHGEHFYPRVGGGSWQQPALVPGLRLRRYPVVSITSITEDGVALDPAVDFETDPESGLIYRLAGTSRVPWYGQLIAVVYVGGYPATADVPFDIQAAMLLMLRHRLSDQSRDPMLRQMAIPGVIEKQWWVGSKGDNPALPPEVEGLICGYRDVGI